MISSPSRSGSVPRELDGELGIDASPCDASLSLQLMVLLPAGDEGVCTGGGAVWARHNSEISGG
eukprot:CAMPEP_0115552958 /NCGR_PEP_ID=MMETSP0271-20121206/96517_1 /TAXON_ID=71861 /ORGANISM="Scrippsiella trochoidea, Strain CCMP3099" /LENGTH=63 /DNA_ID=CAMNT_0002986611 /DNA_START=9 /DNA_END=197 /DNA_ORIENTATION=+